MHKHMVTLLVVVLAHGWAAQAVFGQGSPNDRRERRRQLVEGLLKSLIESQAQPPRQPGAVRPQPRPVQAVPADLRQAQRLAQTYSQESTKLIGALRQDERLIRCKFALGRRV